MHNGQHGGHHQGHGGMMWLGLWGFVSSFPNLARILILVVLLFLLHGA